MKAREREVLASDSRSGNMLRRLAGLSAEERRRRRRWILLGGSGTLLLCKEPPPRAKQD